MAESTDELMLPTMPESAYGVKVTPGPDGDTSEWQTPADRHYTVTPNSENLHQAAIAPRRKVVQHQA